MLFLVGIIPTLGKVYKLFFVFIVYLVSVLTREREGTYNYYVLDITQENTEVFE